MVRKENQKVVFHGDVEMNGNFGGNSAGGAVSPGTGSTLTFDRLRAIRHVRLTLASATIAIDEADDFGSLKLCDLADSNAMLLMAEVDLTLTKAGTTNGIVAATDLDVGVGTAAASATTLATTMIDVLEKTDIDDNDLEVTYQADTQGQSTASTPIKLADSATLALYLNAVAVGGITVSDTISVSGTVDLYFVDLGNVNS